MLTRLSVTGFKSLIDVEVVFGPLTCIAGLNAAGKSNLLDVIMFLSDLTDYSIVEAASRVRDRAGLRRGEVESIFSRTREGVAPIIVLEAEFLVSKQVTDDFGQETDASATHLKYRIEIELIQSADKQASEKIRLAHESLTYIPKQESRRRLAFPHSLEFWNSVIGPGRRSDFISTEEKSGQTIIRLKQDGGDTGRALDIAARRSSRTVLSTINTADKPTALAAKREMQSWKFLQLEPARLRLPSDFDEPTSIDSEGAHLPAAVHRLNCNDVIANRLAELIGGVESIHVDVDEGRRLKTLFLVQNGGNKYPARSLSDGTLRFLALATLAEDTNSGGLIALEEPENGIHPSRIPAILALLGDIAVDCQYAVTKDNPLRQVVITTHSPAVVQSLDINSLLMAMPYRDGMAVGTKYGFVPANTWREKVNFDRARPPTIGVGTIIKYLSQSELPGDKPVRSEVGMSVRSWSESQQQFDFMQGSP